MPDRITIPEAAQEAAAHLIEFSALADCTTTGYDGGLLAVQPHLPVVCLSSGERVLWSALKSLARGETLTVEQINEAARTLDTLNLTALNAAFGLREVTA